MNIGDKHPYVNCIFCDAPMFCISTKDSVIGQMFQCKTNHGELKKQFIDETFSQTIKRGVVLPEREDE